MTREERLRELCGNYRLEINPDGPWQTAGEEDIAQYFWENPEPIRRYALVTAHDEFNYIYTFTDLEIAKRHATEDIDDSIWSEYPLEIVDLETGVHIVPKRYVIEWETCGLVTENSPR